MEIWNEGSKVLTLQMGVFGVFRVYVVPPSSKDRIDMAVDSSEVLQAGNVTST